MTDQIKTTGLRGSEWAWLLYLAWCEVDRCDAAIQQYAEAGISGSPHDLEHREARAEALFHVSKMMKEAPHVV